MLRRDEHGAVIIITAISMLMVLSAVALAVDIGDLVWRKRQIQGVVDLASLDAVRALSDQRDANQSRCDQTRTIAQQSATRNNFDYSASGYSLSVQLGTIDQTTKAWSMLTDCVPGAVGSAAANAVKVIAQRPVLFSWLPGSDTISGTAIATFDPKADIAMGTYLASFDAPSLDKILGCMGRGGGTCSSGAGVTAVGYNGLANATINYGDLFTQLNIGTANDLANTQVSYKSMLLAAATVLNNKGDTVSAGALNTLAASADATLKFKFGDFISTTTGTFGEAAAINVNAMDLVGMAAQATVAVANTNHFLEVDLPLSVAGASVHIKMSVIEPPVHAYGPARQDGNGNWLTTVHTAQVRLQATLTLANQNLAGLVTTDLKIGIYAESASGDGALTNIACAANNNNSSVTVHATTSAVKVYVGQVSDGDMTNTSHPPAVGPATLANVGIHVLLVTIPVTITAGGTSNNISVISATKDSVMTGAFTRHDSMGAPSVSTVPLSSNMGVQVAGAGLPAATGTLLQSTVNTLIAPVVNAVGSSLLDVLAALPLNLKFAGADLWNAAVDCGGRRLVG